MNPWTDVCRSGSDEDRLRGEQLLMQGKAGCLILAGGQGTRLGISGPKGMMSVTPFLNKTLFQLFSERTRAASERYGVALPLCVMTSPLNHLQTVAYFEENSRFGLSSDQLFFIQQEMLAFLDEEGNPIVDVSGQIVEGPCGNGDALRHFFQQEVFAKWQARGICFVNVILVDNALADPFDAEFLGFTERMRCDAALKSVERLFPEEKMGVLVDQGGKLKIVEYSELTEACASARYLSTSLFCFSMDFISYLYERRCVSLPLHVAHKNIAVHTADGLKKVPVRKRETFIFDLLDYARQSSVLVYPREHIYAPLKNAEGDKSLETVRAALLHFNRYWLHRLTGIEQLHAEFELDPAFYYPDGALLDRLRGHVFPTEGSVE